MSPVQQAAPINSLPSAHSLQLYIANGNKMSLENVYLASHRIGNIVSMIYFSRK